MLRGNERKSFSFLNRSAKNRGRGLGLSIGFIYRSGHVSFLLFPPPLLLVSEMRLFFGGKRGKNLVTRRKKEQAQFRRGRKSLDITGIYQKNQKEIKHVWTPNLALFLLPLLSHANETEKKEEEEETSFLSCHHLSFPSSSEYS